MKTLLYLFSFIILFACQSNQQSETLDPSQYFNASQLKAINIELGRWIEPLPPRVSMSQRWDTSTLYYYSFKSTLNKIYALHKKDSFYYFAFGQVVPSLHVGDMRVHFGRFSLKDSFQFKSYEEFYLSNISDTSQIRQWVKESMNELIQNDHLLKTDTLLNKMEWPNDYFYFNKKTNQWDRR